MRPTFLEVPRFLQSRFLLGGNELLERNFVVSDFQQHFRFLVDRQFRFEHLVVQVEVAQNLLDALILLLHPSHFCLLQFENLVELFVECKLDAMDSVLKDNAVVWTTCNAVQNGWQTPHRKLDRLAKTPRYELKITLSSLSLLCGLLGYRSSYYQKPLF